MLFPFCMEKVSQQDENFASRLAQQISDQIKSCFLTVIVILNGNC